MHMSRKCQISGSSHQNGNRVSHANNRTAHVFKSNIQTKRIFVPELNKTIPVKLSARMIRTIDKIGLLEALRKNKLTLSDITAV